MSMDDALRLYRGEGKARDIASGVDWSGGAGDAARGRWFTTSESEARGTYAGPDGKVYSVDIPPDRMKDLGNSTLFPGEHFILPEDLALAKTEYNPPLPMDEASRLARAREMGFNVDKPWYHGTAREFDAFDPSAPRANDSGHYGKGIYFAQDPGEAGYYGPNVGKYYVRAQNPLTLLDDAPIGGRDLTDLGHFRDWAPKLDKIGYLDEQGKEILAAMAQADEIAKGARILPHDIHGGGEAYSASVRLPNGREARTYPPRRERSKEETMRELVRQIYSEMNPGKDEIPDLARYIMRWHREGSQGLTDKAKAAGHDAIRYGDELVVFDPHNIRSADAAFDPAKASSSNLLASHIVPLPVQRKEDPTLEDILNLYAKD